MQNTVLPEDFQEDTSHLNSPTVRDASASHSDNEEQDTSDSHSHTDEDEEKNIASNIEKSWKTIEECIHKTNFSTSKKPSKSRKPSSRNQEKFGYKLRDFFPPDMRKGCKKDTFINKAHPVDNQRSLFASTTITNLKKEVEKKISDETQITKAYGIITEFLLNDEIFYLPKTLLHQILNFPPSTKPSTESYPVVGVAALPTDTFRYKCDSVNGIDIIRKLPNSPEDDEIIQKFIIPGLKKMIISNCNKKLRNLQTWGAKVMRYVNYSCALILILYPNGTWRERQVEAWFEKHLDEEGLLTRLPPWEVVCRFFNYYKLVEVEQQFKGTTESTITHEEKEAYESKEDNQEKIPILKSGRNSPLNKDYTACKKILQERYMRLNLDVHQAICIAIHKDEIQNIRAVRQTSETKNYYKPCLEKHRAFVSDLFNYIWKYHQKYKVGIWHHEHPNIANEPINLKKNSSDKSTHTETSNSEDNTKTAIAAVIKGGIHEEEFEFMEFYLQAESIIYNAERSKFGRLVDQERKVKIETLKAEIKL